MSAPLSVIIPTLNAAHTLPACLAAIGDALFDGLIAEVIFADGGSDDDTAKIADAVGARVLRAPKGRGQQLSAGVAAARGNWLLIVHADSVLGQGWAQAAQNHIEEHADKAAYFRLAFASDRVMARITAGWGNLRARLFGLPFGDQGLLISRAVYQQVGGYPAIPLMEDVAIARSLRGRLRALPVRITTAPDRYEADGWVRRGAHNLGLQARYFLGASPSSLAERYRK